jgi:hypothetical protein
MFLNHLVLAKRRKRLSNETSNGNVFVCASNLNGNSNNESVVFINNNNNNNHTGKYALVSFVVLYGCI